MPAVNPQILTWARETAGLDVREAAGRLQLKDSRRSTAADKLLAYESGKVLSRSLLLRMAKLYRRPLLSFYLPNPPKKADRGEDFRTLEAAGDPGQDAIVDALIRNIRARQNIVKTAILSEGDTDPLPFVGSFQAEGGSHELARYIQQAFEIDLDAYRRASSQEEAFGYLRSAVERKGVFALLAGNLGSYHTNLEVEVFRGFALADDIAPFVVINDQDAKAAWSFTLLHEVAHLCLGASGISGGSSERRIERLCDEAASLVLVSEEELYAAFPDALDIDWEEQVELIDRFAADKKISSRFVAFRLLSSGMLTAEQFSGLSAYFLNRWRATRERQRDKARSRDGGPSYYVMRRHKLGAALLDTAKRMLSSGELSTSDVGQVLGVRPLNVGNVLANGGRRG